MYTTDNCSQHLFTILVEFDSHCQLKTSNFMEFNVKLYIIYVCKEDATMYNIILFDGECNFCDQSVQFIIKRDKHAVYKFASIQSEIGQSLLEKHQIPPSIDSLILIKQDVFYTKSTAALNICRQLTSGWKLLYSLLLIPKPLRDYIYNIVARNRYKWFGKNDSCILPTPDIKKRFLS